MVSQASQEGGLTQLVSGQSSDSRDTYQESFEGVGTSDQPIH